jgi:DNA-binding transcriptional ArsR family regulator
MMNIGTVEEREYCCHIHVTYLDPEIFLRVLNHPLRRRILHTLSLLTLERPVSKKELARSLRIPYTRLLFQLNNQLKGLWKVESERKKRGAREELIMPAERNAVYVMLGSDATLYVIDPLANIFGKLKTGTRCRECPTDQWERCFAILNRNECFMFNPEDKRRLEKLLLINGCSPPFTPMDYILACSALRSLEGTPCVAKIPHDECRFMFKIKSTLNKGLKASQKTS